MSPHVASTMSPESAVRLRARFQIHSPCRFWWTCHRGTLKFGYGMTRNVSSGGVSIISAGFPSVGTAVLVEIDLVWQTNCIAEVPPVASGERVLRVEGRVVRHEDGDRSRDQAGFAVMATQATIETAPPTLDGAVFEEHYA